jgi:hypothetical protein
MNARDGHGPDRPTSVLPPGLGGVVTSDVLSSALREATYDWLSRLERLARQADEPSRAALAETELVRLTVGWRALLVDHEPDDDGHCRTCAPRWRRNGWRCSVWVSAHRYLVTADVSNPAGGRHALGSPGLQSW